MVGVIRVYRAKEFDAIHEFRHASGDMMVAVEPDSTVCDGLGRLRVGSANSYVERGKPF